MSKTIIDLGSQNRWHPYEIFPRDYPEEIAKRQAQARAESMWTRPMREPRPSLDLTVTIHKPRACGPSEERQVIQNFNYLLGDPPEPR